MTDCLISLTMMAELFGVPKQTAHRWNTAAAKGSRLPAPDLVVDSKPLWHESTIRQWAQSRRNRLTVDEGVLADLCRRQQLG